MTFITQRPDSELSSRTQSEMSSKSIQIVEPVKTPMVYDESLQDINKLEEFMERHFE